MLISASSYPFLNILWSMLIFFAWVIFIWIAITVLVDVFRRHDIGGWAKAGWVILVVLVVLLAWSFLLGRTRVGRYMYAIGGNAEAARRAGINLSRIRVLAFVLTGLTAGIMGIIYASQLGSISSNVNGGQNVLYAVAAAVIGGTSLFGGRGKMLGAVLGGVIVAVIYNGL